MNSCVLLENAFLFIKIFHTLLCSERCYQYDVVLSYRNEMLQYTYLKSY